MNQRSPLRSDGKETNLRSTDAHGVVGDPRGEGFLAARQSGIHPEQELTLGGPFADSALSLLEFGLAVIPVEGTDGKKPLVKHWTKGTRRPTRDSITKLVQRHPSANVGVVTRLSGVTIVDVDDPQLAASMRSRFGDTPLIIGTPRGGVHLWYKHTGERCRNLRESEGLAVDIKGAGGFVVAPPSYARAGPDAGKVYEFISGSWSELANLPAIRPGSLEASQREDNSTLGEKVEPLCAVRTGRRNGTLFKLLLKQAPYCDTKDDLSDVAETINADFDPPLSDAEVADVVDNASGYEATGNNWVGREQRVFIGESEYRALAGNSDGLHLLTSLRFAHCARTEPFAVSAKAMARHRVIPGWSHGRYRSARNSLQNVGLLRMQHRGGRGAHDPDLYTLGKVVVDKGPQTGPNITIPPSSPSPMDSKHASSEPTEQQVGDAAFRVQSRSA